MFSIAAALILLTVWSDVLALPPPQVPLQDPMKSAVDLEPRRLHGRFLHITDMHPDPYYKSGTSKKKACHRKKPKKKKNRAGPYGEPYSDCDSPYSLIDLTLETLEKRWADEIDWVVWTGDTARHDNDRQHPRTSKEINSLNQEITSRMEKIFTRRSVPVIPTIGNNDIWPHNIMTPGPNAITNAFSSIWKSFIPFPHLQVFRRGGYFSVEVVPNEVAVLSLNTMYWYDSNKAVGGCKYNEPEDPGNLEFDWLLVQLKSFRDRGMQVWLTGHVPPSSGNYFPDCYTRYVDASLRYQDTILGHLFGHMNADHFFFVEADDLLLNDGDTLRSQANDTNEDDLCDALLKDFGELPNTPKADMDQYAVINVAPSVVPNPYLPSFRIFTYNVTDADAYLEKKKKKKKKKGGRRKPGHHRGGHHDCKKAQHQEIWKCHLSNESWYSDPSAPARDNTLWTPLGYVQYYIPDLKNGTRRPEYKLEYATYGVDGLEGFPKKNLPKRLRHGAVTGSRYLPYGLSDLTVGSWYEFAKKLGRSKGKKLGKRFRRHMYLGG